MWFLRCGTPPNTPLAGLLKHGYSNPNTSRKSVLMKSVYPLLITVCACISVILPRNTLAQCTCTGKDSITQYVTVDTSNGPKVLITFNKYQDPTGAMYLACMELTDTISIVSSTLVRNQASGPIIGANFTISVTTKITGPPSINASKSGSLDYGPFDFGPAGTTGTPSDSIVLGPDTMLNRKVTNVSVSNPAPYIGTGTVSDTLTFGGGAFSDAGTSFDYQIRTKYWGSARITFFLCPSIPLATTITNFTASQDGNTVLLQWLAQNEQNNDTYEIQISTDGKQFTSIGKAQSSIATAGTATKYQYQYNLDQANVGKIYFRIRRTDVDRKMTYSGTLTLTPGGSGGDGLFVYNTYPNPVTNTLLFRFNSPQTGSYLLELVNAAGQVIQRRSATLNAGNNIRMDLSPRPARGLYFLRTVDMTHSKQYTSKIYIN